MPDGLDAHGLFFPSVSSPAFNQYGFAAYLQHRDPGFVYELVYCSVMGLVAMWTVSLFCVLQPANSIGL